MPTEAQIEANRRNAKRSTGPRTAEGKSVSSRNALKFGIEPENLLVAFDSTQVQALFEQVRDEFSASSSAFEHQIRDYVTTAYQLHRIEAAVDEQLARPLTQTTDVLQNIEVLSRLESRFARTGRRLETRLYPPKKRLRSQIANAKQVLAACRLIRKNLSR